MRADYERQTRRRFCAPWILLAIFSLPFVSAQDQRLPKQLPPSPPDHQASTEQKEPTAAKQQTPKTAPQVEEVLPAYEGQNVSAIEVAGRPGLDESKLLTLLVQQKGQPFSKE